MNLDTGLGTVRGQQDVFLETMEYLANPPPAIPLKNWPIFTRMTGGFRKHEFTVLCGPSGKGKTTFLANLSAQFLRQGVKHFVMPIETGRQDYMARVLSVLDGKDHNTGEPVPIDVLASLSARHTPVLARECIQFSTHENRLDVEELLSELTYMASVGCEVAIVDNFNFFQKVVPGENQVVEMDRVMHEMIMFCKRVPMHVFMVFHPRKTDGLVKSEYDVKGSSTAIQEAQNVLLFNPPSPEAIEKGESPFNREIKIAKMRRRGRYVGKSIIFENNETVYYETECR